MIDISMFIFPYYFYSIISSKKFISHKKKHRSNHFILLALSAVHRSSSDSNKFPCDPAVLDAAPWCSAPEYSGARQQGLKVGRLAGLASARDLHSAHASTRPLEALA
jgi:hypothetical protein